MRWNGCCLCTDHIRAGLTNLSNFFMTVGKSFTYQAYDICLNTYITYRAYDICLSTYFTYWAYDRGLRFVHAYQLVHQAKNKPLEQISRLILQISLLSLLSIFAIFLMLHSTYTFSTGTTGTTVVCCSLLQSVEGGPRFADAYIFRLSTGRSGPALALIPKGQSGPGQG